MSKKSDVEIMLTVDDITHGTAFTKKIVLKSSNPHYDGKTIEYRALSSGEMARVIRDTKMGVGSDNGKNFEFLIEACKVGIVTPGVGDKADKLDTEIITQIGGAILGVSQPT
jgi:hypothetical protein